MLYLETWGHTIRNGGVAVVDDAAVVDNAERS